MISNEKFKEQELNNTYQDSSKSQNMILNKTTNSVNSVYVDRDIQENKVSGNGEVDNDTPTTQFQYKRNFEILPMYNIHKPTIKVNKEDIEPKKYDIVTTVNNKMNINNKRV